MFDAALPAMVPDLATGQGRLLELRRMAETAPVVFDIFSWVTSITDAQEPYGGCGSILCLFGAAALHPPFQDQGLRLHKFEPQYQTYRGLPAAMAFFELNENATMYLFTRSGYVTARPRLPTLLHHIDQVIAEPQMIPETYNALVRQEYAEAHESLTLAVLVRQ